jgi:hypothetical protein
MYGPIRDSVLKDLSPVARALAHGHRRPHFDSGLQLGDNLEVDAPSDAVLIALEFIARGLMFHETGRRLSVDCAFSIQMITPYRRERVRRSVESFARKQPTVMGPGVFEWTLVHLPISEESTMWRLSFYGAADYYVLTGTVGEMRKQELNRGRRPDLSKSVIRRMAKAGLVLPQSAEDFGLVTLELTDDGSLILP